jgi:hypothetical protein
MMLPLILFHPKNKRCLTNLAAQQLICIPCTADLYISYHDDNVCCSATGTHQWK